MSFQKTKTLGLTLTTLILSAGYAHATPTEPTPPEVTIGTNTSTGTSTHESDPSSDPSASNNIYRLHSQGSLGMGATASASTGHAGVFGVAAQLRLRQNGRGINIEGVRRSRDENGRMHCTNENGYGLTCPTDAGQALRDMRLSVTYNMISGGPGGASTSVTLRGEAMIGLSIQDVRNSCGFYFAGSGYSRFAMASPNDGTANSARFVFGPETGLVCDIHGVLIEISPSVGIGVGIQAQNTLADGPASSGTAIMAGGVTRLSITDRLHISMRGMTSLPDAMIGGNSRSMTMLGADADLRLNDRFTIGATVDGVQYLPEQADSAHLPMNAITGTGVFSGTF